MRSLWIKMEEFKEVIIEGAVVTDWDCLEREFNDEDEVLDYYSNLCDKFIPSDYYTRDFELVEDFMSKVPEILWTEDRELLFEDEDNKIYKYETELGPIYIWDIADMSHVFMSLTHLKSYVDENYGINWEGTSNLGEPIRLIDIN